MYENQFIQFTTSIIANDTCIPLPVVFGGDGISFFVPTSDASAVFTIVDKNGTAIIYNGNYLTGSVESLAGNFMRGMFKDDVSPQYASTLFSKSNANHYVKEGDCFRIQIVVDNTTYYSSLLRRYKNDDGELALLKYACDTETFGLPFGTISAGGSTKKYIRQWLPIWLDNPQYQQKDEVYEKLSGERVVLYATICKEYAAQTDYIPESWHERIILALSCDYVSIKGISMTKSDKYEVDWKNKLESDCGTDTAKATWKMTANVTSRNSNN